MAQPRRPVKEGDPVSARRWNAMEARQRSQRITVAYPLGSREGAGSTEIYLSPDAITSGLVPIKVTAQITAAAWASTGPTAWGVGTCKRVLGLNSLGDSETIYSIYPDAVAADSVGYAVVKDGVLWVMIDSCSTVPA